MRRLPPAAWLCAVMLLAACTADDPGLPGADAALAVDAAPRDASPDGGEAADPGGEAARVEDAFEAFPDVPPPPSHGPIFDPAGGEFLSLPFPSDARRTAAGRPDLSTFPNPRGAELVEAYVAEAAAVLDGFSPAQGILFAFREPVEVSGLAPWLPGTAADPIQLVDVTPGPTQGRRVPLAWRWEGLPTTYLPANVLAVRPVPGITLAPGHAYAAIVLASLPSDPPLEPPAAFRDALAGGGPVGASLEPLGSWIDGGGDPGGDVVVATVFTVGDPRRDLLRIRDYLWNEAPGGAVRILKVGGTAGGSDWYEAEYEVPEFLRGDAPYATAGGGFEFDGDGRPVVQRTVTLRLAVSVPSSGEMPAGGWPLALTSHGTGGDWRSFLDSGARTTVRALSEEGIAGAGIDQPLHGTRLDPPLGPDLVDLYSFNFLNPEAGRTVQRQSVADTIVLLRVVREGRLAIPASISKRGVEERFDPSRVLFFGHSQGGITGALLFGVEDRLRGGVLSGAGAGLSTTVMLRKDPMDFLGLVATALSLDDPGELSEFHPALVLVQMLVDAVDPLAYAAHWRDSDGGDGAAGPRSVLLTEGLLDAFTPSATAEALAVAAGVPVLSPAASWCTGAQAAGLQPLDPPVEANLSAGGRPATGAQAQYPEDGHFAVYRNEQAFRTYQRFLGSLVDGPGRIAP